MRGVRVNYLVTGLNLDRFINYLKNHDIKLYNVKKLDYKRMIIGVNFADSKNFFAIADKMCYNVKKVSLGGWGYPFYRLLCSCGMVIGALCFCVLSYLLSDLVFALEFSGSGSIYKNQVIEFLEERGVKQYSRFSDINLKTLEDSVLAANDRLSFVGIERRGNRLEVELVLSSEKVQTLDGNVYALYSNVSGVVESVKVYRGTAVVKVGDKVNKGDLLVDGYVTLKENTVKINVLCAVSLIVEDTLEYYSNKDGEEEKAELFAQMQVEDSQILSSNTIKIPKDNGYLYIVNVKYRCTLYAG